MHGEPYLKRKISIGHDKNTAETLSHLHEQFRQVATNTYKNANQLLSMGEELKNSGKFAFLLKNFLL